MKKLLIIAGCCLLSAAAMAQRQPVKGAQKQSPAAQPAPAAKPAGKDERPKLANPAAATRKDTLAVPLNVLETFYAKFQKVKNAQWSHPDKDSYEVVFLAGDKNLRAGFSADGRWMMTSHNMSVNELPREIITVFANKMKGYRMQTAQKAESFDRGTIYLVVAQKDGKKQEIGFNSQGRVISLRDLP